MKTALIVVDMQNDFLPGGALAVPDGDAIIPFVAHLLRTGEHYEVIVASQDWHPEQHGSFASAHDGAVAFQMGELAGLPQMLWPDHCIQGTDGARLVLDIEAAISALVSADRTIHVVKKGLDREVDSYSAFFDNARRHDTGLHDIFQQGRIREVDIVGLAFDYCVKSTALDAVSLGYRTRVLMRGTRPVEPSAAAEVEAELTAAGVICVKDSV